MNPFPVLTNRHLYIKQWVCLTASSSCVSVPVRPASWQFAVYSCGHSVVWLRDFGSLSAVSIGMSPISSHFSLSLVWHISICYHLWVPSFSCPVLPDIHRPQDVHSIVHTLFILQILLLNCYLTWPTIGRFGIHISESFCEVFCEVSLSFLSFYGSIFYSIWTNVS